MVSSLRVLLLGLYWFWFVAMGGAGFIREERLSRIMFWIGWSVAFGFAAVYGFGWGVMSYDLNLDIRQDFLIAQNYIRLLQ